MLLVALKDFTFKGQSYQGGQRFDLPLGDAYKVVSRRQAKRVVNSKAAPPVPTSQPLAEPEPEPEADTDVARPGTTERAVEAEPIDFIPEPTPEPEPATEPEPEEDGTPRKRRRRKNKPEDGEEPAWDSES